MPRRTSEVVGRSVSDIVDKVSRNSIKCRTNPKKKTLDEHLGVKQPPTYKIHVDELASLLSKELEKYDLDLSLKLQAVEITRFSKYHGCGFIEGDARLFPNQIETFVEVVASIIKEPWRSIVLMGSTQLGKTMTVILCSILEAIACAETGDTYKTVYLMPNRSNLEEQTKNDYRAFRELYEFTIGNSELKEFTYSDYWQKTRDALGKSENNDLPLFRCANGKIKERLFHLMKDAHEKNIKLIIIVDECHWGSAIGGILHQFLSLTKNLTNDQVGDVMIAISATPFNLCNLEKLNIIKCRTYEGYIGPAFFNGELLDPRYEIILPEHIAFNSDDISDRFGVDEFCFVSRKFYRNRKQYEKAVKAKDRQQKLTAFAARFRRISWLDYRDFCEEKLISLVNNCLTVRNELDARGFIIRFFMKNDEVTDFIERKKHRFHKSIHVVSWHGDAARSSLYDHLRSQNIETQDLKAVFVTGQGRMGNRIEDADGIYYGADFAAETNLTAILQGLLGRMTGKKSVAPIIFLEQKPCKSLDKYYKSLGKFGSNPHPRTVMTGHGIPGQTLKIWVDPPEKYKSKGYTFEKLGLPQLAEVLNEIVNKHVGNSQKLNGRRFNQQEKFWGIFDDAMMRKIEDAIGFSPNTLVRYSEEDIYESPFVNSKGHAHDGVVGFRDVTRQASTNSPLRSTRETSGTKKEGDYRRLQPQIQIRKVKRGRGISWRAVAIKLPLVDEINMGSKVLPSNKDLGSEFASEHEKKIINGE